MRSARHAAREELIQAIRAVHSGERCIPAASSINIELDMVVETEATTGQQAIAKYRELRPDSVLMDVKLPGMSDVVASPMRTTKWSSTTMMRIFFFIYRIGVLIPAPVRPCSGNHSLGW